MTIFGGDRAGLASRIASDLRAIISAVGDDTADVAARIRDKLAGHHAVSRVVVRQLMGDDLLACRIDRKMELAQGSSGLTVFCPCPFAGPKELQPGAVDDDIDGPLALPACLADIDRTRRLASVV